MRLCLRQHRRRRPGQSRWQSQVLKNSIECLRNGHLVNGGRVRLLGQFPPPVVHRQRQMVVTYFSPAQGPLQMKVGRCKRSDIRTSNNVGDAQVHVIDHIRQVIAVDPVRITQPEIPNFRGQVH